MGRVINSSGKRKAAIARVTIKDGKGRIRINKKPLDLMEPAITRQRLYEPLDLAENFIGLDLSSIDIDVNVRGGGFMGQTSAARTAITKGLVAWTDDMELRDRFLDYDRYLLVSDHRRKEPKKPGGRGARKKRQKSYR